MGFDYRYNNAKRYDGMLSKSETRKYIEGFKDKVVREAKHNLSKQRKRVSKRLYESIDGDVKVFDNSFSLSFTINPEGEEYGTYQDKGVSGTEKKYNTPFSYTSKMPPSKPLMDWARFRKLQPRLKNGKYGTYKSMGFILAKSIYKKGIKPSLFFTRPFEKHFKKFPNELAKRFALDVKNLIATSLDNKRLKE